MIRVELDESGTPMTQWQYKAELEGGGWNRQTLSVRAESYDAVERHFFFPYLCQVYDDDDDEISIVSIWRHVIKALWNDTQSTPAPPPLHLLRLLLWTETGAEYSRPIYKDQRGSRWAVLFRSMIHLDRNSYIVVTSTMATHRRPLATAAAVYYLSCAAALIGLSGAVSDPTSFSQADHFHDDKILYDLANIPLGIPDPVTIASVFFFCPVLSF